MPFRLFGSTARFPRPSPLSLALLCIMLLAGCAAEDAYRNGVAAMKTGDYPQALLKLQEASSLAPENVQYRSGLLKAREQAVQRLRAEADVAISNADFGGARKRYQKILQIDPANEEIRQRDARLQQSERHTGILASASQPGIPLEKALEQIDSVLAEDPQNQRARQFRAALTDGVAKPAIGDALNAAYRKPVTLELEEASLRQIFALLARASGINFVFDREVKMDQRSSILLKRSTIESALYYTLLTNQLESQILDSNTVLIYPNSPTKQKDYQELILRTFHLSYADAKNVANYLRTFVKSKDIGIDEKLNLVTIRDTADAIRIAEKLVALQDVPEAEVMLEVEVLEVNRTRLLQLGVNWPEGVSLTPIPSTSYGLTARDLLHNISPSSLLATVGPTTIKAQKQDTDASILANPRIRVRNREKARIMVGERVPNVTTTATATGLVSESINYIDVGLKLEVEPTISMDDDVAIRIGMEVSSIVTQLQTKAGTTAFQLGTRNATTMLSLKDGETQILAGLINDQDRSDASKIPLLGEVPLLGRLFGTRTDNGQRSEIILSITPHLIRNIRRPAPDMASIRSGTEASFRIRPAPPVQEIAVQPSATAQRQPLFNAQDGQQLRWTGPSSVNADEAFASNLAIRTTAPLKKMTMTVVYDPRQIQLVNVAEADFMRQGGAGSQFSSTMPQPGTLEIQVARNGGPEQMVDGSLAEISWRPLVHGMSTQLRMQSVKAELSNGEIREFSLPNPYPINIR